MVGQAASVVSPFYSILLDYHLSSPPPLPIPYIYYVFSPRFLFSSRPTAIHRFNASDMAVPSQYIFLELYVLYFAPEPEI